MNPASLPQPPWVVGSSVEAVFRRPDGPVTDRHPMTVIADNGVHLLTWVPMGAPITRGVLTDGREIREAAVDQRFRLPRRLIQSTWTGTSTLRLIDELHWSSVWWFFEGDTGAFRGWYVNLEIPLGRTAVSVVRSDGVLDVQVGPDLEWNWKDEDEFAAALDAGRLTAGQGAELRAEGERMIALAQAGSYPFDGSHTDFAREFRPRSRGR